MMEGCIINHAIEFIETPIFEAQRKSLIDDEEYRAFQNDVIKNPEFGELIVGTGGLRKARLAPKDRGKSSGFRVIYLLVLPDTVHLILMYKKGQKDSLTAKEKNQLKEVALSIKGEYRND